MSNLAKAENNNAAITPMVEAGREIALIEGYDMEHRFSMRKLGNIHLGVKVQTRDGKEYPKATDYYVLPDDLRNDQEFRAKLEEIGEDPDKPRKLPVMMMSDQVSTNIVTSCDLYGTNGKLKCRSYDGATCECLNPTTFQYETKECSTADCPSFQKKECAWYNRLRFLLPDATGFGYWQIYTKSANNRGALIREMMDLRRATGGHIAGVDLLLELSNERQFHVPMTDRSGKVTLSATSPFLLHLRPMQSIRKLMNLKIDAQTVEDDRIEDSFDMPNEPTMGEDEFMSGEHEHTDAVDAEIVAEPVEEPGGDPTQEEVLRNTIREKLTAMGLSEQVQKNRVKGYLKGEGTLADLNFDQLTEFYNANCNS